MNKQHLYGLINPFERIAGLEALLWGLAGMVVSTALSFYSGWHYHGLLHDLCRRHVHIYLCEFLHRRQEVEKVHDDQRQLCENDRSQHIDHPYA